MNPICFNFLIRMKTSLHVLALSLVILLASAPIAFTQQRIDTDQNHRHHHNIYQQIERDYQKGNLNLDQKVLYKFYALQKPQKLPSEYQPDKSNPIKCGTPRIADYQKNRTNLSRSTISAIESMTSARSSASSETYTSPSGHFNIHYETSGEHAVPSEGSDDNGIPNYVEHVASSADSSYRHQVQNLGYTDPIPQGQTYDIFIRNLEYYYGETRSDGNTTYIRIENDFAEGFPPNDHPDGDQIGAIYATVAHEFKHAIQYEVNNWGGETGNWLEMDATLMEEVVYDNVNDYYNYIKTEESIFNSPQSSFYPGSYYHVTWALFFEEKYGSNFWPQVWEIIKENPTITMVDALAQQLGGTDAFRRAYAESQLWHYASGPENSSSNYGFEESHNYPTPRADTTKELFTKTFSIPRPSPRSIVNGFSAHYYKIPVSANINGDIMVEVTSSGKKKELGVIAYYQDGTVGSSTDLIAENESSFKMSNLNWDHIEKLGLVLTNSNTTSSGDDDETIVSVGTDNYDIVELNHNYPNPFNPQTRIRFTVDEPSHVELNVYDSAGRLVTTLVDEELPPGLYEPIFDGSNLASGVYFYQLVTDQQTHTQQMTLIK